MKVCLLTYDTAHRKTNQVFFQLLRRGFPDIGVMLVPFKDRATRDVRFKHRPDQFVGVSARVLAKTYGLAAHNFDERYEALAEYDVFLVCGANLLEPDFVRTGKILNVHAGLIPSVRGLDSFKWAVFNRLPMGNSLHRIDDGTDAGEVLAHIRTPVFMADTLDVFAERHYESEIWMLGNFDTLLKGPLQEKLETNEPTRRMPVSIEEKMVDSFDDYKRTFALDSPEIRSPNAIESVS